MKKNTVLYELALGNLSSHSRPAMGTRADRERALKTFADSKELLASSLSDYQLSVLKDLVESQEELSLLSEVERFIDGLSLGLTIMAEAQQNAGALFADGAEVA